MKKIVNILRETTPLEIITVIGIIIVICGAFAGSMKNAKETGYGDIKIHYIGGHTYISKSWDSTLVHAEHCPCKKRD